MPTATPFNALGMGNGFRDCPTGYYDFWGDFVYPSRVDVTFYNTWTTLGGYNSSSVGAVTEAQISLSRSRAMQLYWNLYQVNCSVSANTSTITNVSTVTEPMDRVCGFFGMSQQVGTEAFLRAVPTPLWLFKGNVEDWDNFIGFSVGIQNASERQTEFISSFARAGAGANCEMTVDCADFSGTLTSLGGYPFVCVATGDTVDEANFTASSTNGLNEASISISGLGFYTY